VFRFSISLQCGFDGLSNYDDDEVSALIEAFRCSISLCGCHTKACYLQSVREDKRLSSVPKLTAMYRVVHENAPLAQHTLKAVQIFSCTSVLMYFWHVTSRRATLLLSLSYLQTGTFSKWTLQCVKLLLNHIQVDTQRCSF
jgi:hypothetical protein